MATSTFTKSSEPAANDPLAPGGKPALGPPPLPPRLPPGAPPGSDIAPANPSTASPPAASPPPLSSLPSGALPPLLPELPSTTLSSTTMPPAPPPLPPATAEAPAEDAERIDYWSQFPSWLCSTVFHLVVLLLLAKMTFVEEPKYEPESLSVTAESGEAAPALEDLPKDSIEILPANLDDLLQPPDVAQLASHAFESTAPLMPAAPSIDMSLPGTSGLEGTEGDILKGVGDSIAGSLRARLNPASRARMVIEGGGTPASEEAVTAALKWLAEHQNADGSWSYDHRNCPKCKGKCSHPGHLAQAKFGATAMALLPFLGTGQTHREGKYKKNIEAGLYYLVRQMRVENTVGSLWDPAGRMYGHGLGSIVLCEAYGMTRDSFLLNPAQYSINFIVVAQDPSGGGWRYAPLDAGDTSVVGWQLMALKSAHMAYLKVPNLTIQKAGYFLDSVQHQPGPENGDAYGYTGPGNGIATTAIGLLCRMYMGWQRDNPALVRGVEAISKLGPSLDKSGPPRNNMYYNYYATQVLHHYGGYEWNHWNDQMRDYLVHTQSKRGHERGSWSFDGSDHGFNAGGRLYSTAMAAMILEVYYRHLPLYSDLSTKDKFQN